MLFDKGYTGPERDTPNLRRIVIPKNPRAEGRFDHEHFDSDITILMGLTNEHISKTELTMDDRKYYYQLMENQKETYEEQRRKRKASSERYRNKRRRRATAYEVAASTSQLLQ